MVKSKVDQLTNVVTNLIKNAAINLLNRSPQEDGSGNNIEYREHDVNNKQSGQGRDAERFVTGSDGSIYYTNDHYGTFIKIK